MKTESIKICEFCNHKFISKRSNHLCCSHKCSSKHYQERKKIKELNMGYSEEPYIPLTEIGKIDLEKPFIGYVPLNEIGKIELEEQLILSDELGNAFHELTEKELNLSKRKSRVKYFSRDIVDYILIRLELDKKLEEFHPQEILNDLIRYDIIKLTFFDLKIIIPELVIESKGGIEIDYTFFNKTELVNKFSDNLTNFIIDLFRIPTEEQLAKSGLLKMMTAEIRQIMSITTKSTEPKKDVFAGVIEMIDDLYVLVNRKFDSLNQKIEKAIMISEQNVFISNNANVRYDSFEKQLQLISEKIDKIKIKRGFFG